MTGVKGSRFRAGACRWAIACSAMMVFAPAAQAKTVTIASPDGKVQALLSDDGGKLQYRVTVDGRPILSPSPLGMRVDGMELGDAARIGTVQRRKVDNRYRFFGGKAEAVDRANVASVALTKGATRFEADVHVADDGVGVRLRLPAKAGRQVEADRSGWKLAAADPRVWVTNLDPGYEAVYEAKTLGQSTGRPLGLPLTAKIDRYWVTISEAAVVNYGDMGITPDATGLLEGNLYADPKGWQTDAAVIQPWRVTIVARDLTGLVNTTLIQNLNPPPSTTLAQADWIRPGVSSWQWLAIGAPKEDDQHQWVDWTRQLGYRYYLVDEGWAAWKRPWESLEDTVRYARSQGVDIWVWVDSKEMFDPAQRQKTLRRYADMGIVGVKVDFPQPPNHIWATWYQDFARDAAADRLMVDFHGAMKPTGTERTWPNVLTREAVRGHEWHITRYKRVLPGPHDTILPFTRYIVGPGDYTPTVFEPAELQGNSWAHEVAQAILFTSPYLSMGGHPKTYLENPARDVLKAIPAIWDETIVLPGSEPGTMAGFARRRGKDWFVAVINGTTARPLKVDLRFLGAGSWTLVSLADSQARPDAYDRTERTVKATDSIDAGLRTQGGYVGWLRPAR
ncbi:glycoside hydrolase family 97 protein [Sphingomonas fuzhouensis]|uniref:glycoside hydrolase family 97 protein n=1 Tax=Sphingomonas fuzhouensis TaxID=3106033 RepID=UPI002AFF00D0|nr:glycoside hydrolase family 97 catalytic domain-containing protein [Sphingomonas sp. SGZ-02]